jgi:lactate dehydrogenase-like 2-hydroxyacid dehydrogenase
MAKTILNFDHFDYLKLPFYDDLKHKFRVVELFREKDPDAAIQEHSADTVAVMCNTPHKITRRVIEALPNLEIISTNSVGFDHIDLDAAKERGIVVTNTPDIVTNDTADVALSLILNV